ncbi:alpha/beta hydrolase [Streptomyces lichenis]|uniref:Alpha/beta hydrolase n=1 Tax=Streptomyces lichenis TaxID=2306967 RepID=A0ABT0IBN5_9ACTN|nr:alpha/beta hydrolase [Streptomyces lichenis]MCK8678740.1 alpha/beta hydrolase [Streptomyces lichenis]
MKHRTPLALTLAAAALAATAAAPYPAAATSPAPAPAAEAPAPLRWGPCPKPTASPSLRCATLKVPLDYRHPGGRTIEIALSRLPSENPAKRRGVLLTNPGGPGAPGLAHPADLAAAKLPRAVLDAYDIIGFDPRGTGRSTPVTCHLTPAQQQRGAFPVHARGPADVTREASYARTVARRCATSRTTWMLPHTTTANTARDMDRIRAALGESTVSYLGHSYGSQLGAVYATMFPRRGDRIVLDSVLGPGGYDVTAFRALGRGMEDRFPDFAAFAAAHPEYGLGSTPAQVTATYHALARRLDAKPVEGVDGTLFRGLTFQGLYVDGLMPVLARAWQDLAAGRLEPGELPPNQENTMAARLYVLCADSRWPRNLGTYQLNVLVDRLRHPLIGASTANVTPCAFWPDERREPPVRISDRGPSNILLVQNERDPGTPLTGAQRMRRTLGERARMVTADQGGHGVYPFGRNTCANDAATAFLTTGRRPSTDLACPAEARR